MRTSDLKSNTEFALRTVENHLRVLGRVCVKRIVLTAGWRI